MPDGWATAMMELVLRVNKEQAQRDINSLDGNAAGRKTGQQFGGGFTAAWERQKRDTLGRFVADSGTAGDQAGSTAGGSFTSSFSKLLSGMVTSFYRGAAGRADAAAGGQAAGSGFGDAFTRDARGRLRDFQGRFAADMGDAGDQAGTEAGRSFASSFLKLTAGVVTRFMAGTAGGGGGGAGGAGFLARAGAQGGGRGAVGSLAAGIGPNILGLQVLGRAGLIGGGAALGLGALPALVGAAAPLGLAGIGAGAGAALFGQVAAPATDLLKAREKAQQAAQAAQTPAQKQAAQQQLAAVNQQVAALDPAQRAMFTTIGKLQDMWKKFTSSFAPLFAQAIAPIPQLFASILPALRQFFQGAVTLIQPLSTGLASLARSVLPLLGQAFRATGPLLQPLLTGFGQLLSGLLPGLITLLKAAAPAATVFANFLGGLGRGLGGMFAQFAPVIQSSSVLLGDLLGLVNALLPIIGQLAGIFARTLAPAFTAFAGIIQTLLPGLTIIGRLVAQLAAAMLTDLTAAFQAVAGLFAAIGPALTAFARAISGIFTVLENTGVWAILGNAIESIVGPLGALISAVLRGLTPILPPLIGFIGQLSAILATQLGQAIAAVLPPLTQFAAGALGLVARFIPPLLPLITQLARQLGGALVAAVVALAPSLTQLATVALQTLAVILPVVLPVITAFARVITGISARAITDLAIALNAIITAIPPRVLSSIVIGLVAIVGALKLWAAIQAILNVELVANPIGLVIAAVAGLAIGITELVRHWNAVWGAIRASATATGRFFTNLYRNQVVQDILAVWTLGLLPLAQHWDQVWAAITRTAVAAWHGLYSGVLSPIINWFTVTLPHGFDMALGHVRGWWRDVASAFAAGWNTVWRNTITPMANLFTRDLPGWFNTAVSAAGRFWGGLYNTIRSPVVSVVDHVLNGLIRVFNTITGALRLPLHIGEVHPFGLAGGGKVTGPGGPRADKAGVYALSDTEWVIQSSATRKYGDDAMNAVNQGRAVIGFQAGGRVGQHAPPPGQNQLPAPGRAFAAAGPAATISGPGPFGLGDVIGFVGGEALRSLAQLIPGWNALANSGALSGANLNKAFSTILGRGTYGATGVMQQILTQLPRQAAHALINWIEGHAVGSASAIVNYALSFLGKIPYVWGGTAVPGGADCCLPGDQPVLTSTGPKPIIDLRPGDWVVTWEENRPAVRQVTRRSAARHQMTYLVVTPTTELEASGNHPFLTVRPSGWEWTEVNDLRLGDLVVRYDERTGDFREEAVVTVEPQAEKDTYDITVDGTHCFIAAGLVVHNSGFVQAIYQHFGIVTPRTSEGQGAWVRRSGPTPGGLALYHSPPGGPDPGHVAIVKDGNSVISQGGGMGPQIRPLHYLPLLWTGVPPGGFGAAGGGRYAGGVMSKAQVAALWAAAGGGSPAIAAAIAGAESGDDPNAVQKGQPPGLTGWGLWQITPTSGIWQNGPFGNLLNPMNNARAGVSLWRTAGGFSPWVTYNDGAYRRFLAKGGWINEPVTGVGKYSRALYNFGEAGREYVTPEDQMAGGGDGGLASRLDYIAALLEAGPARTAAGVTAGVAAPARLAGHAAWIGAQ